MKISQNSFDTGAIFRPRSGHDLSRNASVVSGYAFYKNSNWRKGFLHDSEIDKIFEKVSSGKPELKFLGPAGAHAPQGCIRPGYEYAYDS